MGWGWAGEELRSTSVEGSNSDHPEHLASFLIADHEGWLEDFIQKACRSLTNGCLGSLQNYGSKFSNANWNLGLDLFWKSFSDVLNENDNYPGGISFSSFLFYFFSSFLFSFFLLLFILFLISFLKHMISIFLLGLLLFLIYFSNYLQVGLQCHTTEALFCLLRSH